ncbi:MAG: holin family protein [Bacteriophage sp.]|nr:MAG: holin family protein [Bacteriophage sp.]
MTETLFYEILAILVFTITDYITGIVGAVMHGNLSSTKMREGLGHKFAYLCVFFIAWFIDFEMKHIDVGFHSALTPIVTIGIVLTELSSIIENIGKINPQLTQAEFMKIFNDYNKENNNDDTNTTSGR